MKHLRRFNENSHDWRANAFPGMSEEEIEKTLAKAEEEEEKVISDKESEEPYESPITDEQREMINMGYPASQVLYGEDEETTEGSKIKNFFNFKK